VELHEGDREDVAALRRAVEAGERVFIRHPVAADRREFLDRAAASRRLLAPWVAQPSGATFDEYVRRTRRVDALCFLVCRRDDGAIVGVASIGAIVRGAFLSGYVGYHAFEPFAGVGYMSEGIRLVLRHAFGPAGLHRVEANIQPGNEASRRLAARIGFRLERFSPRYLKIRGRWRDHERWAILAEEFHARRAERRSTPHGVAR
jgi:ribosomal-protein-alanine N-acetyltransferase